MAGLWCRGITVLDRRENLLGRVTPRCRAEFPLRLCLPRTDADNAARQLDLQTRAAAERAAGRGPELGTAGRAVLRAAQGRMARAAAGGVGRHPTGFAGGEIAVGVYGAAGRMLVITVGPVTQGDADAVLEVCRARGLVAAGLSRRERRDA